MTTLFGVALWLVLVSVFPQRTEFFETYGYLILLLIIGLYMDWDSEGGLHPFGTITAEDDKDNNKKYILQIAGIGLTGRVLVALIIGSIWAAAYVHQIQMFQKPNLFVPNFF